MNTTVQSEDYPCPRCNQHAFQEYECTGERADSSIVNCSHCGFWEERLYLGRSENQVTGMPPIHKWRVITHWPEGRRGQGAPANELPVLQ